MVFFEKFVEDKARGEVVREVGLIESEWPAHTGSGVASGYRLPDAGSCSILLSIPSGMWFKPRSLWVDNYGASKDRIVLYLLGSAGDASATIGGIWVGGNDTGFIPLDTLTVGQDIWVSGNLGSVAVRIGGILLASGPEN